MSSAAVAPFAWIIDALPALISYIDPELRYAFVSEEYRRWFGVAGDGLTGRRVREVLGPAAWENVEPYLRLALAGERVTFAVALDYPTGRRDVEATYIPHVVDGAVVGLVAMIRDRSAAVQAARRLAVSEERLQLAVDGAGFGTWFRDYADGTIEWNAQHARLLGLPADGVLSDRDWLDALHRDDRGRVETLLAEARERCGSFEFETRVRRADTGEYPWLAFFGRFRPGTDGATRQSVGVVFDVTERKTAELRRRREQDRARLFAALEASARGLKDPSVIALTAMELLRAALGADRCAYASIEHDQDTFDVLGAACAPGVATLTGRYSLAEFGASVQQRMRAGQVVVLDDVAVLPDGAEAYRAAGIRAMVAVPLVKDGGLVAGTGVHMRTPRGWAADEVELVESVTERIWESVERARTARALERREAEFRALFELSLVGMVESDLASGRILRVNARMCELSGYAEHALIGRALPELTHPEDRRRAEVLHSEVRAGRHDRWTLEKRLLRADGATVWVQIAGRVVSLDGTSDARTLTSVMDITAFKDAEASLREADRRKDAFLATLAHELRNPLAPIRFASRLFRPGVPDAVMLDASARVDRQLAHMTRLLDDLMDVSRITRGLTQIRRDRVNLVDAVDAAREAVQPAIDASGHVVAMTLPAGPLWILGDATRLVQIVGNLLQNALKYSPAGSTITLSLDTEGDCAVLRVRDRGIGISPDALPTIFEMFNRGEAGRSRVTGLGIGLALVRELSWLHGGEVVATSDGEGQGSEFVVRLPLDASVDAASERPDERDGGAGAPARPVERILIVDDNVDGAIAMSHVLGGWGYAVAVAHDGANALQLADRWRPDTILLDIGLPDLSGHDVARRIRAAPWGRDVRLIAVTGWGTADDREQSRTAGIDRHLTKPVDPDELRRLLGGPLLDARSVV